MGAYQIAELLEANDSEPCNGLWAFGALCLLGEKEQRLTDDEVQILWPKLAGRPAGEVKGLLASLGNERRELWTHRISEFAKQVPAVRNAAWERS
jgi:hypothetical protein